MYVIPIGNEWLEINGKYECKNCHSRYSQKYRFCANCGKINNLLGEFISESDKT